MDQPQAPGGMSRPEDESIDRVEVEPVDGALDLGPPAHGEDLGRKLEKRMNLKARATAQRIFDGNAPRADITGRAGLQGFAADLTARLPLAQPAQQAQVPVAQVGSSISNAARALENALRIEQAVGIDEEIADRHGFLGGSVSKDFAELMKNRHRNRNPLSPNNLNAPIFRQPTTVQYNLSPFLVPCKTAANTR